MDAEWAWWKAKLELLRPCPWSLAYTAETYYCEGGKPSGKPEIVASGNSTFSPSDHTLHLVTV